MLNELPTGVAVNRNDAAQYIRNILREQLPKCDQNNFDREIKWSYVLDKQPDIRRKKTKRKRKTYLTRKERESHNLLKLSKQSWDYEALSNMREMWKDYMRENLELAKIPPDLADKECQILNTILSKSEYVGAEIEVIRSTCPSVIGIRGTIVLETKCTFQVVTVNSQLKSELTKLI